MVVDLDSILEDQALDVALEDGDKLHIPKRPESISVIGEVYVPNAHVFKDKLSINEYITEIRIPKESKFIGLKIKDIENFTEDRLSIFGYIDEKGKIQSIQNSKIIQEEDRFLIKADPVDLKVMMDEYTIRFTKKMRQRIDKLKDDNTIFKEVLITPGSQLENRNRNYLRRRTSNSLVLMAIARQAEPIRKRLGEVKFRIGDVLLLQGRVDNLENNINLLRLLPLEQREMQIGIFSKVGPSLLIFFGAILLSIFGILPTIG